MLVKVNLAGSSNGNTNAAEERLGCYRLWAKPREPRKAVRGKPGHMVLGPYPLGTRK